MKYNKSLAYAILKATEEERTNYDKHYELEDILYHIELLTEEGYLKSYIQKDHQGKTIGAVIHHLTLKGHDFLSKWSTPE